MTEVNAFGNFDEGNDEFVLQNPNPETQPGNDNAGDIQFPVSQEQFGAP